MGGGAAFQSAPGALVKYAKPRHVPCKVVELTSRQREVMELVCLGKTNWEIGTILGISEATVKNHVNQCCRKLGAVNRTRLAVLFDRTQRG